MDRAALEAEVRGEGESPVVTGIDCSRGDYRQARLGGAIFHEVSFHGADLTGAHCKEAEFIRCDFRGARLAGAELCLADFVGCDLSYASLHGCDLTHVNFVQCTLAHTSVTSVGMNEASFMECDLTDAVLEPTEGRHVQIVFSNLSRTRFRAARLYRPNFIEPTGERPDLVGAQIEGAFFMKMDLSGYDFRETSMTVPQFHDCVLDEAIFEGMDLTQLGLIGTSAQRANFSHAQLLNANLARARLCGSSFARAYLDQSLMIEADLSDADFTGARMTQARMSSANCIRTHFPDADLTYVDLSHARLTSADLRRTTLFRTNLHEIEESDTRWDGANRDMALETDPERKRGESFDVGAA